MKYKEGVRVVKSGLCIIGLFGRVVEIEKKRSKEERGAVKRRFVVEMNRMRVVVEVLQSIEILFIIIYL